MRKLFAQLLLEEMNRNDKIVLITADMGYGLWDDLQRAHLDRYHNVGSAEQLMLGVAAGLAMEGKIPVCYSITPFLIYRPFEFIRNFMNIEKLPIKLAGGGRDTDYGYLGFTHHATEDIAVLSQLQNIKLWKPENDVALQLAFPEYINNGLPSYINLIK